MQSPWHILQLNPDSASEKDIKVAYARLIKLHRPDTDPEGFRRIREAYEISLSMVREGSFRSSAPTSDSPEATDPTPPSPTVPSIPAALAEAERAVHQAREAGDSAAVAKAVGSLFYTCRTLQPDSAGIRLWQESLHRSTGGQSDVVASGVTISQLLAELEAADSIITHACIGHWEAVRDIDSMLRLADAILTESQRLHVQEAAIVALRLALETGFAEPKLSVRLTNFAFPHLDREAREQFLPQVEQQAHMGAVFAGFRRDQLAFWHQRVRRPNASWRWSDPASEAALEYLTSARDRQWAGYQVIRNVAPTDWLKRMDDSLERKLHSPPGQGLGASLPESYRPLRHAWMWLNLIWIIPLVAVFTAQQFFPANGSPSPSATPATTGWSGQAPEISTMALPQPQVDFATGETACQQRTIELLNLPSVGAWNRILRTMEKSTAEAQPKSTDAQIEQFRRELQSLFQSISRSESDQSVEQHVLELLLMDPTAGSILKEEAIFRQTTKLPLSMFLPIWQRAARAAPEQAVMVGRAAAWYIANHGHDLSVSSSERQDLAILAGAVPQSGH